ncbi:uncharacterized protein CBL_11668 [Carabus blaptoides fortunei]
MASMKCVIVLTPNGRRQTVKVTPNTTILQILEEVCKKQGFKVEEHDLKHHNHVLDVSSIIRFSGLPNNAQLEMCAIQKLRSESPVILCVQLENGTRLTGNYVPNDTLLNILSQICPDEIKLETNPVVIYMRQEIIGTEAMQKTTLKLLGLNGGRAMVRLIHRKPEELHTQANVSAPLPSKPPVEKPYLRKLQRDDKEPEKPKIEPESAVVSSLPKKERRSTSPTTTKEKNFITDFIIKEKSKKGAQSELSRSVIEKKEEPMEVDTSLVYKMNVTKEETSPEEEFTFLGERNALAFSLDMAQTIPHEDLPDEFFDLTIQDARKLFRDLKNTRVEYEENPLLTSALRKLEEDKKILRHLNQYKKSVIRVQFPDRTVLQGTFKPLETIDVVMNFVRDYLEDSSTEFHLYTTPPKSILDPKLTLLDAACVPSAIVHFGLNNSAKENQIYLRNNLLSKLTSHSLASLAAARSRGKESNICKSDDNIDEDMSVDLATAGPPRTFETFDVVNEGASTSSQASQPANQPRPVEKVPKWFKPNK